LQHLGHSRSAHTRNHLLQTPDTFVRSPLPGMRRATAIVHISSAGGAAFTQYTAEFERDGELPPAAEQRFLYVLEGEVIVNDNTLVPGDFAYLPPAYPHLVSAAVWSRAEVIEKPYEALDGRGVPAPFFGRERDIAATCLLDDPWLEVRGLIPDDVAFDFRVNTMTFRPGATLAGVEMHVMEHGLLMLEGGGVYRLGDAWYPVQAGDFIWMAPYCPQWFGALGKTPAKYLIYKDWDRHPV
jgi:(S)-ureidoglycine aminohydrolase